MAQCAYGRTDLSYIGSGLKRPECVLTVASGETFVADARGGVTTIHPDLRISTLLARGGPSDFLPNGVALLPDRSFAIANLGAEGGVWRLGTDGTLIEILRRVDGYDLPPTNFVGLDHLARLWITVSTRKNPRNLSLVKGAEPDGFVVLLDASGARIVTDGLSYTNEAKVCPKGDFLYINETAGRRLVRHAIRRNGDLGARETVAEFGSGVFPDGLDFDVDGGVWITSVVSNRLIRIDPANGRSTVIFEDTDPDHVAAVEEVFQSGRFAGTDPAPGTIGNVASLAFGGPDLRTIYLGTLSGQSVPYLRSPATGFPPPHWLF